ncbi:hypothetical protein EB061_13080, partial [bacterium]|nr:hypothetical protein [bacterium]
MSSVPSTTTAGVEFDLTVSAKDAFGNTAIDYAGTVEITSSDPNTSLPAPGDLLNGTGSFTVKLHTAGPQTITASDGTLSITSGSITVNPGAYSLAHSTLAAATATVKSGLTDTITLTLKDAHGNLNPSGVPSTSVMSLSATSTAGTGTFGAWSNPSSGVFTKEFTGAVAGATTISATVSGVTMAATVGVTVLPGAPDRITITAPSDTTAGEDMILTVHLRDASNNITTEASGTLSFTSSDAKVDPADLPSVSNATGTITAPGLKLKTAGSQTITASLLGKSATSTPIQVIAATATQLVVNAGPPTLEAGNDISTEITAVDPFGNVDTGFSRAVSITAEPGGNLQPG